MMARQVRNWFLAGALDFVMVFAAFTTVGCSKTPTSPTGSDQNPPPAGPVALNYTVQIVRPASATTALQERSPMILPKGLLELRVAIQVGLTGGSASVTNRCGVKYGSEETRDVPELRFSQTVHPGAPVIFHGTYPFTIAFPPSSASGSLDCTLTGTDQRSGAVNVRREVPFTLTDLSPVTSTCTPDGETLCLLGGRFKVKVFWRGPADRTGSGGVAGRSDDSGVFFFSNASAQDLIVQLMNACPSSSRYWVFMKGASDYGFTLTITDTRRGVMSEYEHPRGVRFDAAEDRGTFATCP